MLDPALPAPYRWIASERASDVEMTQAIADPVFAPAGRAWWIAVLVSLPFVLWFIGSIGWLFYKGIGIWGVNSTVVWGVAIANYVWWIGIGNAGTLISSMLLLTRQQWRGSINRFAEAMTLFAVAIAGIMPIIHVGRPIYAYWLAPYPNTMALWPQWRSALVWDFWAIVSYLLFSILFWYVSPDPRSCDDAGPHQDARGTTSVRRVRVGLARIGPALEPSQDTSHHDGRARRSPGLLGALDRRARLRREPDAGLAGKHFPALFRGRRDVLRLCDGGHPRARHPLGPEPSGDHHRKPLRGHGQDPADGLDRDGLFLRDRMVHGLVRRPA